MSTTDARKAILSRRAKFVAAAIAAAGIAVLDESRSSGAPRANDAGVKASARGTPDASTRDARTPTSALAHATELADAGKLVEALAVVEDALQSDLPDSGTSDALGKMKQQLEVLCPTIALEPRPDNVVERVLIDGIDHGPNEGHPFRVDPGRHTFVIRDETFGTERLESVVVREGARLLLASRGPEANPRPCLQPLYREDPPARGCGCPAPGARTARRD